MNRPNVFMIILDTVRAKNLSLYGYEKPTTPNLEKWAKRGFLFTNAFSPAIWTIPSHASMFTGLYPSSHGALNLRRFLDSKHATLAEALSASGYHTISFANNRFLTEEVFGFSRGFQQIPNLDYPKNRILRTMLKGVRKISGCLDCGAAATNHLVRQYLNDARKTKQPFFIFMNHMEAHSPYEHVYTRFLKRFVSPSGRKKLPYTNQDRQKYLTREIRMTDEDFELLRSVYDSQIAYLDHRLNQLLQFFEREGFLDDSIIIVTSDHGDMIGEHEMMHHSYCVYEELIKVPLLLFFPDARMKGKIFDGMVSLIDLPKTLDSLLDLNHLPFANQQQGRLLPIETEIEPREYIFSECERPKNEFAETFPEFDFSSYDRQLLTIRSMTAKYIWSSSGFHELYDISMDPEEKNNIIDSSAQLVEMLNQQLFDWYDRLPKAAIEENMEMKLDEDVKSQLEALGYF